MLFRSAPGALGTFLTRLAERNKDQAEKNGLFASHPETKERIAKIGQLASSSKVAALVEPRYKVNVTYLPTTITAIATVPEGSAGLAGSSKSSDASSKAAANESATNAPKKKGFGIGALSQSVSQEKSSEQVSASGGARGLGPDRLAKGGGNPTLVKTTVSADELSAFQKGIS